MELPKTMVRIKHNYGTQGRTKNDEISTVNLTKPVDGQIATEWSVSLHSLHFEDILYAVLQIKKMPKIQLYHFLERFKFQVSIKLFQKVSIINVNNADFLEIKENLVVSFARIHQKFDFSKFYLTVEKN
jgi:hypothetical protein